MKTRVTTVTALLALASVALTSGCGVFDGPVLTPADLDDVVVSEEREHTDFTGVELRGIGSVEVRQGRTTEVTITTDQALMEHITTSVVDGVLTIDHDFTFVGSVPQLDYVITVPDVESLTLSGAGTVRASGIDADVLDIAVRGVGDVVVDGRAKYVTVAVSGAGNAHLEDLRSGEMDVSVTGVGDAHVTATRELTASIAGAGSIHAAGMVSHADVSITGAGDFQGAELSCSQATVAIKGLGDVEIAVSETLTADLSGLGSVTYHGSPHVTVDQQGLGSVRQAD